ncbi:hypothetical protein HMPREF9554_00347 [Treponema phagedenis F0421]|nr:hypothetical protein HMPREF9554_00347 [Treponema phagedenis F0421]
MQEAPDLNAYPPSDCPLYRKKGKNSIETGSSSGLADIQGQRPLG